MSPRGRPRGSRNAFSRPHTRMIRLTEDELGWLLSQATPKKTVSDVIRELIEQARTKETQ